MKKRKPLTIARERIEFVNTLTGLEQTAHRLGLHIAAHLLNDAKNASGWVMAGDTDAAVKAAHRQRPR